MHRLFVSCLAALVMVATSAGPAASWPGMFLVVGYMKGSSPQACQDLAYRACTTVLGSCQRRAAGQTLAVSHTEGAYNFSVQCTYFRGLNAVLYGVSGSADKGRDRNLLPKIKQIMDIMDQRKR